MPLCDVRQWYLKTLGEGYFDGKLTNEQEAVQNEIEYILLQSKKDPNKKKVECILLEQFDDILKQRKIDLNHNKEETYRNDVDESEIDETDIEEDTHKVFANETEKTSNEQNANIIETHQANNKNIDPKHTDSTDDTTSTDNTHVDEFYKNNENNGAVRPDILIENAHNTPKQHTNSETGQNYMERQKIQVAEDKDERQHDYDKKADVDNSLVDRITNDADKVDIVKELPTQHKTTTITDINGHKSDSQSSLDIEANPKKLPNDAHHHVDNATGQKKIDNIPANNKDEQVTHKQIKAEEKHSSVNENGHRRNYSNTMDAQAILDKPSENGHTPNQDMNTKVVHQDEAKSETSPDKTQTTQPNKQSDGLVMEALTELSQSSNSKNDHIPTVDDNERAIHDWHQQNTKQTETTTDNKYTIKLHEPSDGLDGTHSHNLHLANRKNHEREEFQKDGVRTDSYVDNPISQYESVTQDVSSKSQVSEANVKQFEYNKYFHNFGVCEINKSNVLDIFLLHSFEHMTNDHWVECRTPSLSNSQSHKAEDSMGIEKNIVSDGDNKRKEANHQIQTGTAKDGPEVPTDESFIYGSSHIDNSERGAENYKKVNVEEEKSTLKDKLREYVNIQEKITEQPDIVNKEEELPIKEIFKEYVDTPTEFPDQPGVANEANDDIYNKLHPSNPVDYEDGKELSTNEDTSKQDISDGRGTLPKHAETHEDEKMPNSNNNNQDNAATEEYLKPTREDKTVNHIQEAEKFKPSIPNERQNREIQTPDERRDDQEPHLSSKKDNTRDNMGNNLRQPYLNNIEDLFKTKTLEYASKIQNLEILIMKLENQLLMEKLDKQNHSSTITRLENSILKLENELLKLNQSHHHLKMESDEMHKRKNAYLELDHVPNKTSKQVKELRDQSSKSYEIITEQENKIFQLAELLKNQSKAIHLIKTKYEYLEDQNRMLFQMVMNQTTLMTQLMSRVQELSDQNIQHRVEAQMLKEKLALSKMSEQVNDPTLTAMSSKLVEKLNALVSDKKLDMTDDDSRKASIKIDKIENNDKEDESDKTLKDYMNKTRLLANITQKWCGENNTICLFKSIRLSRCVPFVPLFWSVCEAPKRTMTTLPNMIFVNDKPRNIHEDRNTDQKTQNSLNINSVVQTNKPNEEREHEINTSEQDAFVQESENKIYQVTSNKESAADGEILNIKNQIDTDMQVEHEASVVAPVAETHQENINTTQQDNKINEEKTDLAIPKNNQNVEKVEYNEMDDTNRRSTNDHTQDELHKEKPTDQIKLETPKNEAVHQTTRVESSEHVENELNSVSENKQQQETHGVEGSAALNMKQTVPADDQEHMVKTVNMHQQAENKNDVQHKANIKSEVEQRPEHKIHLEENIVIEKIHKSDKIAGPEEAQKEKLTKTQKESAGVRKIKYEKGGQTEPKDCYDYFLLGHSRNSLYKIKPYGLQKHIEVYCDMSSGGWTLIQKRSDGTTKFFRDWAEYKTGFGGLYGEHWIGNDNIHFLTNQDNYKLRIVLTDWNKTEKYAEYKHFSIEDEQEGYKLDISGYSGDAGDGMEKHNGHKFSTKDVDNDMVVKEFGGSCANRFNGAWWYYKCYMSNLNGIYYRNGEIPAKMFDGITWKPWTGSNYSLRSVEMKIRPASADDK